MTHGYSYLRYRECAPSSLIVIMIVAIIIWFLIYYAFLAIANAVAMQCENRLTNKQVFRLALASFIIMIIVFIIIAALVC